jgi:hypothetical protein
MLQIPVLEPALAGKLRVTAFIAGPAEPDPEGGTRSRAE